MACCQSITMTVQQSECPSNNNNPVPNSMVVVANVDFGTFTVSIPNGSQGPSGHINLPVLALGTYRWDFISGFMPWNATNYGIACIPEGGLACGDSISANLPIDFVANVAYTSPFSTSVQTINGSECSQCGLVDACDTTALQATVVGMNPVLSTSIFSTPYGTNMPDITAFLQGNFLQGGITYTSRGGSITWKLTQTQHIFPQPVCIRIRNFPTVKADLGICVNAFTGPNWCAFNPPCVPTLEWDGSFPFRRVIFPQGSPDAQVSWYPGDDQAGITPKPPNGPPHTDTCELTLNGMALATTTLLIFETAVQYRNTGSGGSWQLRITGYEDPTGAGLQIWIGAKDTGDTPVGTYTRDPSSCALAPDTICIEECTPTPLTPTPTNTITTPQLLFGSSAYAQTTDITVRPNLVFFNDQTGLRKIDDVTILAGSTSFGGDVPHHLDYATSTDRVFVSVISATSYIAVVNPQTMGIDTTFNNALPYQFNYLKYSPQYDRLVATQSDGTNLHGRIINPNTNSIVANFTFSTSAATEFQGGIDYHPGLDQIFVARQGDVVNNQSLRIFQGTTFAFLGSIDLGTLVPNDMMFVDEFGKFVVVGSDFNTSAGMIAIVNPGNQTIEHMIMTGTTFPPTSVVYDPVKRLIVADCATALASVSMLSNTLVGTSAISSLGLSMAFNPTNNKVYHPASGTTSIDLFS